MKNCALLKRLTNGAGLLSNVQFSPMDIFPNGLVKALRARPFNMSFTRQMKTAQNLYGKQLQISEFSKNDIQEALEPLLPYYPPRDRQLIADRVVECVLIRQKVKG